MCVSVLAINVLRQQQTETYFSFRSYVAGPIGEDLLPHPDTVLAFSHLVSTLLFSHLVSTLELVCFPLVLVFLLQLGAFQVFLVAPTLPRWDSEKNE